MGREYEIKLLAEGSNFATVVQGLKNTLLHKADRFQEGTSIDAYWQPAPDAKGSFIRMRVSDDDSTLTTKINDRNDITDRKEYNVAIMPSQKDELVESLIAVLGEPTAIMWRYVDFRIGMTGTTISVIQNIEKPTFVFIEVECSSKAPLDHWVKLLRDEGQLTLKQVKNSFFDIFVKQHGVML